MVGYWAYLDRTPMTSTAVLAQTDSLASWVGSLSTFAGWWSPGACSMGAPTGYGRLRIESMGEALAEVRWALDVRLDDNEYSLTEGARSRSGSTSTR